MEIAQEKFNLFNLFTQMIYDPIKDILGSSLNLTLSDPTLFIEDNCEGWGTIVPRLSSNYSTVKHRLQYSRYLQHGYFD